MNFVKLFISILITASLYGCAPVSSTSVDYVPRSEQTVGPIFITQSDLSPDIEYEIIGVVKANARQGYDSVESLYPLLAEEARKVGANAVIKVYGGRTVHAFSWAAPFTGGTAVRVRNTDLLKNQNGSFFQ